MTDRVALAQVISAGFLGEKQSRELWAQVRYGRHSMDRYLAAADAVIAAGYMAADWEYEYADDDDPEGNVYGRFRRVVGPWEPHSTVSESVVVAVRQQTHEPTEPES